MPRCRKCHSQWATYFRCPHCETKFPCPLQLVLVSVALPAVIILTVMLFFSFRQKISDWQEVADRHESGPTGTAPKTQRP
jgi:hypothetical protein